jgi:hypothetical protein
MPERAGTFRLIPVLSEPVTRSVRFEVRVEPALADAVHEARGLASASSWIEHAIQLKLASEGIPVARTRPAQESLPIPPTQHEFPRRPPSRPGGGRKR